MVTTQSKTELKDLVNGADTYEQGKTVYDHIIAAISLGKTVRFSFHGTHAMSSSFMHGLFGNLIEAVGKDRLRSQLKISNCTPSQVKTIKDYMQD